MDNRLSRLGLLVSVILLLTAGLSGFGEAQLANVPWPMFQHDLRHTGRSAHPGPSALDLKWT